MSADTEQPKPIEESPSTPTDAATAQAAAQPESGEEHGAIRDFLDYCEAERERRRNGDGDFDEARFDAAMSLALDKLRHLGGFTA